MPLHISDLFSIALVTVTLAFTRPLYFHLFRRGGRLYGSTRGRGSARVVILFAAISLSTVAVWLFLVLCLALPALRSHMQLWITLTILGGLSLGILGVSCILSWRVKGWLAKRGLGIRAFALIAGTGALVVAIGLSQTNALAHPLSLSLACVYLACGVGVRVLTPLPTVPSARDVRSVESRGRSGRRVVVIVFDELDQRLLLEQRLPGLNLPTIDAFVGQALTLENAIPPSRCTEISIPGLLTGKIVYETIPQGPTELEMQLRVGGGYTALSAERTMFHDAFDRGYRIGCTVGYHPLDRILPGLFTSFAWQEVPDTELGIEGRWLRCISLQVRSIFETPTFSPFADTLYGRHCVSRYHGSVASAVSILRDDSIDLAFLHLPVPHPPFIFDRHTGEVTARHARKRSYDDNLALVDRTLATLLEAMRESDAHRESAVILTSDHWWRHATVKDVRVPFAIWFSDGRSSRERYGPRRNTIFLRDLALELLDERLTSSGEVADWLDSHARDHPPSKT